MICGIDLNVTRDKIFRQKFVFWTFGGENFDVKYCFRQMINYSAYLMLILPSKKGLKIVQND